MLCAPGGIDKAISGRLLLLHGFMSFCFSVAFASKKIEVRKSQEMQVAFEI